MNVRFREPRTFLCLSSLTCPFLGKCLLGPLPADSAPPRKPCLLGHGIHGLRTDFLVGRRYHPHPQRIWLQLAKKLRDISNSQRVASRALGEWGGYKRANAEFPSGRGGGLCLVSVFCVQATSIAEVLCLTAFFGRLVHFAKVTPQMVFWKDTKNICIMVTIAVSAYDRALRGLWSKAETMKRTDLVKATVTDLGTANPVCMRQMRTPTKEQKRQNMMVRVLYFSIMRALPN